MPTTLPQLRATRDLPPEDRAVHLFGLLDAVRRLRTAQSLLVAGLQILATFAGIVWLLVAADAALGLPASLRVGLNALTVIAATVLLVRTFWGLYRERGDAHRAARLVECRLQLHDSLLINAVEFCSSTPRVESPQLRQRTIDLAEERSRNLSAMEILSFRPVGRALVIAAAAGLLLLLSWLFAPRLVGMVVPRYLDPFGDHPPFTLVTFEIEIAPQPVHRGRPAQILARLGGPEQIEQAEVVFLHAAGPTRIPMFRREQTTFVLDLDQAEDSQRFYIDTPRGRSVTQDFTVHETPFFEEVTVRFEYPAYTGWPAREQSLQARGLHAIAGTIAHWTVHSNVPLASGELQWRPLVAARTTDERPPPNPIPETIPLTPRPSRPNTVQGRQSLSRDGVFSLTLQGAAGGESLEPLTGRISVVADKPPRVAVIEPQPQLVCVENWTVPVVIEAVDDVGLSGLTLSRSVNGWGPATIDLPMSEIRSGVVRSEVTFDLAALGARAGDIISYYATAADNHPDPTHFADSPACVIQVISEQEYIQFARQQYQLDEFAGELDRIRQDLDQLHKQREQAVKQLQSLQDQLESAPDDPALLQQLREAQQALSRYADRSQSLSEQLRERAAQLELYDLEKPYHQQLERLAKQLQQEADLARETAEILQKLQDDGLTEDARQQLQRALEQLQQQAGLSDEQQQLDAARRDLELFQQADAMLQQVERLRAVIRQQRELATRFGELQNQESLTPREQQRADQLAQQQELLEQELQEIAQQLETAAETAQERLPQMAASARAIAEKIGTLEIPEDQQQAAARARAGSPREAHHRANQAAEKLESLSDECQNCTQASGEMGGSLDGPLSLSMDSIQRTLDQLSQGRNLPPPSRPGQGSGQGQRSGSEGTGSSGSSGQSTGGEGDAPRWSPGQSFPGSQARLPIVGPRMLSEQQPNQLGGQFGENERGSFLPDVNQDPLAGAETLTPESRTFSPTGAGNLRGVPVPFRKDAESYFRRLAEDEAAR